MLVWLSFSRIVEKGAPGFIGVVITEIDVSPLYAAQAAVDKAKKLDFLPDEPVNVQAFVVDPAEYPAEMRDRLLSKEEIGDRGFTVRSTIAGAP